MATAKVLLYKSNTRKDGTHPVVIQITHKGKSFRLTYYHCLPKFWDFKNNRFKRSFHGYRVKNAILIKELNKVEDTFDQMMRDGTVFTKGAFKDYFYETSKNANFFEYTNEFLQVLFDEGKLSSRDSYRVTRNRILAFNKNKKDLTFADIDSHFLRKLEKYLIEEGRTGGGVKHIMITIRALFNRAKRDNVISSGLYPFYTKANKYGYSFSHLRSIAIPRAMSKKNMDDFKKFNVIKYPKLNLAHKVFLFSYYCMGINFTDICKLQKKDIYNDRIHYMRSKTKGLFSVKISSQLKEIIETFESTSDFIFPFLDHSYNTPSKIRDRIKHRRRIINQQLNQIGKLIGFTAPLTTYVARHTFADALNKSGVDIRLIQEALGHDDVETTKHYLKKVSDSELDHFGDLL